MVLAIATQTRWKHRLPSYAVRETPTGQFYPLSMKES